MRKNENREKRLGFQLGFRPGLTARAHSAAHAPRATQSTALAVAPAELTPRAPLSLTSDPPL